MPPGGGHGGGHGGPGGGHGHGGHHEERRGKFNKRSVSTVKVFFNKSIFSIGGRWQNLNFRLSDF